MCIACGTLHTRNSQYSCGRGQSADSQWQYTCGRGPSANPMLADADNPRTPIRSVRTPLVYINSVALKSGLEVTQDH